LSEEQKVKFGGGTRSVMEERFDLIPPEAMKALAARFALGAEKHGEGNWKHGDKQFVKALWNHLQGHIADELSWEREEETIANAGAIMWAGAAIAWYSVNKPEIYEEAMYELFHGLSE
jgi:hypothetical protein